MYFLKSSAHMRKETKIIFFPKQRFWREKQNSIFSVYTSLVRHRNFQTWEALVGLKMHLALLSRSWLTTSFISPDVTFLYKLYCLYPSCNTILLMQLLLLFSLSQQIDTDFLTHKHGLLPGTTEFCVKLDEEGSPLLLEPSFTGVCGSPCSSLKK